MRLNAKELIANARVTAPTLPPAAAKLMSDMADRLDVQYVALRESREQVQQLAAESDLHIHGAAHELNASWMLHKTMLGAQAALLCISQGDIRSARDWLEGTTDEAFIEMPYDMTPVGLQAWFDSNMTSNDGRNGFLTQEEALELLRQRTPATSAFLATLHAEGVELFAAHCQKRHGEMLQTKPNEAIINEAITATRRAGEFALHYAAQIRSQSAPSPEAEQPAASPAIVPLPVERDQYGYWTHPAYDEFCNGREHIPSDEFNAWMDANGLAWTVDYRDEEDIDPAVDGYDISKWQPEAPAGKGWFVGSIHDTEDGAVCIWLRNKSETSPEATAIARQFEQVKGGA